MAIKPPSDIVLDVARSADPARLNVAVRKLAEAGSRTGATDFAADLAALAGDKNAVAGFANIRAHLPVATPTTGTASPGAQKTAKEFEAVLLQKSIEVMLPNSSKIYGKGNAGSIWKSMLAQELANQLVNRGGIGLASYVATYIDQKAAAVAATAAADTNQKTGKS
ncbi:rod-binding protein [Methylocella sp. CPCC 101449]|uniref:rod-binding protein n=1 Tax=Methylocella sp. CPCC 101449 TaxID=2987531 RepID=UPI00288F984E|nr:rod-binding protein [Methylocella sp. CPCC 101449]MDT2021153.1 rod-binding protein [Methylocella sp. CPCC 101449]